jgi:hypothetical protein
MVKMAKVELRVGILTVVVRLVNIQVVVVVVVITMTIQTRN